jgi:post-segregation antitoxin (ccd killing protein)
MIYVKRITTIRINPQILEKAKKLGLNISQACENALRLYINALENANRQIAQNPSALTKREVSEPQGSDKLAGPPVSTLD